MASGLIASRPRRLCSSACHHSYDLNRIGSAACTAPDRRHVRLARHLDEPVNNCDIHSRRSLSKHDSRGFMCLARPVGGGPNGKLPSKFDSQSYDDRVQ